MLKYDKLSAIFTDDNKNVILVEVVDEDGAAWVKQLDVKPGKELEEFLTQVTLEEVEENTVAYHKRANEEAETYERELINKIKKEIGTPEIIATDRAPVSSFDPSNMSTEDLFKLKLQAFEIEEVKTSKNRNLKARVRKATSFMEVLAFTSATILDNQK